MNTFKWLSCAIFLVAAGCSGDAVALRDFDKQIWQEDRNGCNGDRAVMKENLVAQKEKLLALDEMDMIRALGKPDQRELYKRNEKFFYYYLDPSSACPNPSPAPQRLAIRFNAVGLAKEINVE